MGEAFLPVTGYLDRLSHRPGESFSAYVSVRGGGAYRVRLVRVISADPNPNGPGVHSEDLSHRFAASFEGRQQDIHRGSYGIVARGPARGGAARTWTVLVQVRTEGPPCAVLAEEAANAAIVLAAGRDGAEARLTWPGGQVVLGVPGTMRRGAWYRVWLAADPTSGRVVLGHRALAGGTATITEATASGLSIPAGGAVLIGAEHITQPSRHFTGKLEAPAIFDRLIESFSDAAALSPGPALACWDFSIGIAGQTITDLGPEQCHGRLVNRPTRAVVGAHWSGREMCWRHAPGEYAAIHFHADDLDDCCWQQDFSWEVPKDLLSGAYALHLAAAGGEDWLPFYVLPPRSGPFAPIAFLAPTFTYQAYANHARGNADASYRARVAAWSAYPYNPDDYPIYGRSTYNRHVDDSGIAFSSRLRPWLNMRPGFLTVNDARGSGLRHYPADTHLLGWLTAKNFRFDVITDEDLDNEGVNLLNPYQVVLTGSHPEYHTERTLDALTDYAHRQGGKLAYLGGNGFYWRIARSHETPHVTEIRRAEGGIRAWAAEPGEYYHATDGSYGGMWRRNRRPPQMLVGVGFTGQGLFEGTHYRRLPASHDPCYDWMFAGIDEEILGDYGLSGGGAAGLEFDRADTMLGTPETAVILARSENPPVSFVTVPEELLSHIDTISGEPAEALKRAEVVFFETPSGGAVFSVGSITFCGSLWRQGFEGPVSRLLENVLKYWSAAQGPA